MDNITDSVSSISTLGNLYSGEEWKNKLSLENNKKRLL